MASKKRPREESGPHGEVVEAAPAPITPPVNKPVLEFVTALLHYAVQYGKLGVFPTESTAEWTKDCTAQLIKCFNDGKTTLKRRTLISAVVEGLGIEAVDATNTIIRIYDMATKVGEGEADFNHVLNCLLQVTDEENWRTIAKRMLDVFGLWCNGKVVTGLINTSIVRFVEHKKDLVATFVKTLGLDEKSMCKIAKKADDFPKQHEFQGRTDEENWRTMAKRMLYVFGLWCNGKVVTGLINTSIVRFVDTKKDLVAKFMESLGLDEKSMCKIAKKADDFPKQHEFQGRTYHGLAFATTNSYIVYRLIDRTPRLQRFREYSLPEDLSDLLEKKKKGRTYHGLAFATTNSYIDWTKTG
ncbi:Hypothetical protein, putative [Bodo saltans]|uniref:Uncharacterized protein n=1 Tax=Bodo saltans TaxID=75058 RepID=A0A0S4J0K4_BODSA|nr:Hypothetical protein, putative [Bodo saltans]|eukprot:CUG20623.1 Hypothetical protein, putative [Bodo saltans]